MIRPSICVFCGARSGTDPAHAAAARALGTEIARHRWRLVYGAGDIGLMGEVARAAQAGGAQALGVIPVHLLGLEQGRRELTTFLITENMHERKKVMFMNSDALVVLPGGAGTLDEFFEVVTWAQIGLHRKPIFLLDIGDYWQPLVALVRHIIASGFAAPDLESLFTVVNDVETLAGAVERALSPAPEDPA